MEISLTTPALLFPAISLLMLAFTNRFLALATLIRNLHDKYRQHENKAGVLLQIRNLRLRLRLIRSMQFFGILALLLCVISMFFIYRQAQGWGELLFAASLIFMMVSLLISLVEIQISTRALEIELSDMEGLRDNTITDYFKTR
jgi:Protein of unknown function (DUF2721)